MASVSGRRIDVGKLIMVPLATLALLLDVHAVLRGAGQASATGVLRWLNAILLCAFYALIIWCYLRRGPAVATSGLTLASVVAVIATFAPFPFPLLHHTPPGLALQVAADVLIVAGTSWAVWALRSLGRNLSVIAQARDVAERGPYRLVRHPLYLGEMVSLLGLALASASAAAFAAWAAFVAMQVYRARREEEVLLAALPGYQAYRARTAALLPGVF
ncbi:MAG TPA: isoprenylcysteine carboxylmethyltransferase family protein [Streptosporangiaceae bacterium]|nr:isoprenylcysteine carboxylmethyltransferase family protein [Streptosporangiaceae bacterium]